MAHVQLVIDILHSESLLALSEADRAKWPLDLLASEPDAFGCFLLVPGVIFGLQATYFPSQTIKQVEKRIEAYQLHRVLEVWIENGRTWAHWVAWFKPKIGGGRINAVPRRDRVKRKTPTPPSLSRHGDDIDAVKCWSDLELGDSPATSRQPPGNLPATAGTPPAPIPIPISISKPIPKAVRASVSLENLTKKVENHPTFKSLYSGWRKKIAPRDAAKAFAKICQDYPGPELCEPDAATLKQIQAAARSFTVEQAGVEAKYQTRLSKWLNDGSWQAYETTVPKASVHPSHRPLEPIEVREARHRAKAGLLDKPAQPSEAEIDSKALQRLQEGIEARTLTTETEGTEI